MKTVLAVEDDPLIRRALYEKLTNNAFTVLEAKDGEEGLAIALEKHPDIILLDIVMPKMDGITLLRKLRQDPWGKDAAVIILTNSLADDEKNALVLETHPAFYLVKSDSPIEDVLEKVKEVLGE